ncbi:MAG: S-layer homology domain-containing protein, partial [Chromatiaceae bacterium]|nr:S-layer homology domain-containing protein [Chromatiaceae bacterium]
APTDWACGHIKRLVEMKITQGCGNGNYCPNAFLNREEMAAFLSRAFLDMD